MSGRRRASDRHPDASRESARDKTADLDEQSLLGNQAVAARLGGDVGAEHPLAVARDAALPLIERAGLALQLEARGAEQLGRFEHLVRDSDLDADRKAALLDRLRTDELVAADVASAVRAVFGEDGGAVRDGVDRALDRVSEALREGVATDGGWRLPDGRTVEVDVEGGRTGALITSVGDVLSGDSGSSASGSRILAFCQRVQLALLLEEEEEPIGPDYGPEEAAS